MKLSTRGMCVLMLLVLFLGPGNAEAQTFNCPTNSTVVTKGLLCWGAFGGWATRTVSLAFETKVCGACLLRGSKIQCGACAVTLGLSAAAILALREVCSVPFGNYLLCHQREVNDFTREYFDPSSAWYGGTNAAQYCWHETFVWEEYHCDDEGCTTTAHVERHLICA